MSWFVYVCWDFGLCRLLAAGNRHSINKFGYTGNRSCKAGDRQECMHNIRWCKGFTRMRVLSIRCVSFAIVIVCIDLTSLSRPETGLVRPATGLQEYDRLPNCSCVARALFVQSFLVVVDFVNQASFAEWQLGNQPVHQVQMRHDNAIATPQHSVSREPSTNTKI